AASGVRRRTAQPNSLFDGGERGCSHSTASGGRKLTHAYGDASDIPSLLAELELLPPDVGSEAEPYFSLWSALCHQGDIYAGSYAAVPHIVRVMGTAPERVPMTLFLMVAGIEIARSKGRGPAVPPDLQADYSAALARIPELVAEAAR